MREPAPDSNGDATSALDAVMRQEAEKDAREERKPRASLPWRPIFYTVLLAGCAFVWFSDPAWLRVQEPPALSPREQEAGVRFGLYLQAQRIEHYRKVHGRLPRSSEEAGVSGGVADGLLYQPVDGTRFRLTATGPGGPIVLDSADSMAVFLGKSASILGIEEETR